MVWDLCRENPGRIVVSLDVHADEEIATRGWTFNSGRYLDRFVRTADGWRIVERICEQNIFDGALPEGYEIPA